MLINAIWFRLGVSSALLLVVACAVPSMPKSMQRNSPDADSISTLAEIRSLALAKSPAYSYVQELSDAIGPRLTGSPQAALASQWAMLKMKRSGLQNVHLEPWHIGRGWTRGHALAQLEIPFRLDLSITSYGWVGSTKAQGESAEVALVNSDQIPDEIKQHAASWKGKVLFLAPVSAKHVNPIRSFSQMSSLLEAAIKVHAVAVISSTGRPGSMQLHTGPAAFRDSYFSIPVVDIVQEHQQLLQRLLLAKQHVKIKIDVQNSVSSGSVVSSNVVGEIPGSDRPDQAVILCAHLDSWDLGTGSVDDGIGVGCVLAAADAIIAQHIRPLRTIRFILFTGEEEGLLGSLAYVKAHRAEMKNIVCAFALDWGTGPVIKLPLAGHEELETVFSHFSTLMSDIWQVKVDHSYLSFTDGYAFTLAGVPGIAPLQDSPNYVMVGHSGADTLDKVDRRYVTQDSAYLATIGFWAANYPTRLGEPWNSVQTKKALVRDNQQTLLELCNLWPFGPTKH